MIIGSVCAENRWGSQRVNVTLDSLFLRLALNADVVYPLDDITLPTYMTDYAVADDSKWRDLFFGDQAALVKDELQSLGGENFEDNWIYYPEYEHMYSYGSISTRYDAYRTALHVRYLNEDLTIHWAYAEIDGQADGIETTPAEAVVLAQTWIDQLDERLGWGGLSFDACYAMPPVTEDWRPAVYAPDMGISKGFYIVEFTRTLNGLPLSIDKPPYMDVMLADIEADYIDVFVTENGVSRASGFYRSFNEDGETPILVSLDEAIEIVRDNMDYVAAYRDDSTFEIDEIGLCYRLIQYKDTTDKDAVAVARAVPAWRFASKVNKRMTDEYVIFIDAASGKVLP
jgi:hypothetical protein